jgi:hypothetical protein
MSEQDLRKLILFASNFSEQALARQGEVHAMYHAVTSGGEHFFEMPTGDKNTAVAMVRALFELKDVIRYVFFAEAWTVMKPVGHDELKQIVQRGVSQHPERVEIVMLQGEDRDAGLLSAHRRIIRPPGKRAHLGPLEWHDLTGLQSEGRLVGLLPVRGAQQ